MPRNKPPRETELLHALEPELRSMLPPGWRLDAVRLPARAGSVRPDLVLEVQAPDRSMGRILVGAKRKLEPRGVAPLLDQFGTYGQPEGLRPADSQGWLVVAPHVSPRSRELLSGARTGWYDSTGNLRVQLDRPALFLDRQGSERNPYLSPDDRRLRSLRGPSAARVIRSLLDDHLSVGRPVGVRTLAARSKVSPATGSRVLDLLDREHLVERDPEGAVIAVRKRSLARRWAQDYGLMTTNNAVPVLAPRGIESVIRDLTGHDSPYAVTGAAALRAYLPADRLAVAPLALLAVFVDDAVAAQRDLRLRPAERGSNVLLIEPFDPVVYRDTVSYDGLRYVSRGQAVIDLLTGPGRSEEQARQLAGFLATSDKEWAQ